MNVARNEISNNITYLSQFFNDSSLMFRDNEKRFAVVEAIYAYKMINDKITRSVHGIYPYDLKFQIIINSSWNEDEKRELIYKFYKHDSVYYNILSNFYNYYDSSDSYKVKLFNFLLENMPSSLGKIN